MTKARVTAEWASVHQILLFLWVERLSHSWNSLENIATV